MTRPQADRPTRPQGVTFDDIQGTQVHPSRVPVSTFDNSGSGSSQGLLDFRTRREFKDLRAGVRPEYENLRPTGNSSSSTSTRRPKPQSSMARLDDNDDGAPAATGNESTFDLDANVQLEDAQAVYDAAGEAVAVIVETVVDSEMGKGADAARDLTGQSYGEASGGLVREFFKDTSRRLFEAPSRPETPVDSNIVGYKADGSPVYRGAAQTRPARTFPNSTRDTDGDGRADQSYDPTVTDASGNGVPDSSGVTSGASRGMPRHDDDSPGGIRSYGGGRW